MCDLHVDHSHTCELYDCIGALVLLAQRINRLASDHWQQFSTENYFDPEGFFISTVFSVPLVLNATVMLVSIKYVVVVGLSIHVWIF